MKKVCECGSEEFVAPFDCVTDYIIDGNGKPLRRNPDCEIDRCHTMADPKDDWVCYRCGEVANQQEEK